MKLYIPDVGDSIKLSKDWEFKLYDEYRNRTLINYFELTYPRNSDYVFEFKHVTLPAGIVLTVDRIYIRKGRVDTAEYSSVTFVIDKKIIQTCTNSNHVSG